MKSMVSAPLSGSNLAASELTTRQPVKDNMDKMHLMADALMKYETIDSGQIDEIMEGKIPSAPESWSDDDDSSNTSGGVTSNTKESPATTPVS